MKLIDKARYLKKAYFKIGNKKSLLKKIFYSIHEGGIKNLKNRTLGVIYAAYKEENLYNERNNIYENQQKEIIVLDDVFEKISVIVCIYDDFSNIERVEKSLGEQVYKNFDIIYLMAEKYKQSISFKEKNVHYCNKVDGSALNEVINKIESSYFLVINIDDYLSPNAILNFTKVSQNDEFILIYSDECLYDFENKKVNRYFLKPKFSPVYFYNKLYIEHSILLKKKEFMECGGFDNKVENLDTLLKGATLKILEFSDRIVHIEKILLLRDVTKQSICESMYNSSMIKKHLRNIGIESNVRQNIVYDSYDIDLPVDDLETVSLIIISDCKEDTFVCIDSIVKSTRWINFEIIVVAEDSVCEYLYKEFTFLDNFKLCKYNKTLSYAQKCNLGNSKAMGKYVAILKDYISIEDENWLSEMIQCFKFKNVGAVSPKIINKYNGIKYSGIISGGYGFFPIPFDGEKNIVHKGYNEIAFATREISVLSSSCFVIKRELFNDISGFDEKNIPNEFSNTELSFKIQENNNKCIFCSKSLVISTKKDDEYDSWYSTKNKTGYLYMLKNWANYLLDDPYYTKTMQKQIISNFPYEFNIFKDNKIKINSTNFSGRNILIISHELSMTGAPITLQYVIKALIKNGDYPVILSPKDGKLKEEFLKEGIPVIIDDSIYSSNNWMNYAENFDIVIVNTIVQYLNIIELSKTEIPTLWWIHDAREGYELYMKDIIPSEIGNNIHTFCAGIYAKNVLNDYRPSYKPDVLLYGLPDFSTEIPNIPKYKLENEKERVIFVNVGTIEKRKGQDVFSQAISSLPDYYIDKCKFIFIGRKVSDTIYDSLIDIKNKFPENIELIDEVKRNEIMDIFKQATCIVCSSRDDPMPVFMTEGMMMSKICICSENTGTATLIENGKNGFVYANNDYKELANKIMYVIDNNDKIDSLKIESRKTYEKYFSMDVFDSNLLNIISNIVK